jgi:hypothetical protein
MPVWRPILSAPYNADTNADTGCDVIALCELTARKENLAQFITVLWSCNSVLH